MTEQATLPESAKWYKVRTGVDSSIPFVLARSTIDPFTVALDTEHDGLTAAVEAGRFNLRLIPHAQKTFVQRCVYSWAPVETEAPEAFLVAARPEAEEAGESEGQEEQNQSGPTEAELAELEAAKQAEAEAEKAKAEKQAAEAPRGRNRNA